MTKSYPHSYTQGHFSTSSACNPETKEDPDPQTMEDIWKQVLEEAEVEVTPATFSTFFKHITLTSLDGSVATINAPTHMAAKYIQDRYSTLLKSILDKKTGNNVSIVFTSVGVAAPESKKSSAPGPLFVQDIIKKRPSRIRADYTFDTLAVSESNQLAYTAALTVASNIGTRYNPLFLYGSVGVGKTHLMNAIANKAFEENEDFKIAYMTTEEFTNEVVEAIRDKTTSELRKKFRNVNLLLLDDIQFLVGKEKVQEELFHTFNTLIDKGRQIVFSSDRPPQEIQKIEARLASRFEGGLSVDIEPPDFELRCAILLIKARKYGIELSYEDAKTISEKTDDSRALEGFILKLSSARDGGEELNPELINRLLGRNKQERQAIIRPDSIISAICDFYNIKTTQLKGVKRDSFLVGPRHVCMFLLKEETGLTYVEIGNLLGGRDHTTVMHAVEKIGKSAVESERIREEITFIKSKIRGGLSQ